MGVGNRSRTAPAGGGLGRAGAGEVGRGGDAPGVAGARPTGGCSGGWATLDTRRRALFAVHTMTGANRIRQVAGLVADDPRIQVVFSAAPDAFGRGVEPFLHHLGALVLPWPEAAREPFDLAVAAGYGELEKLRAPVVVLPHGAGHHKRVPRQPGAGPPAACGVYGYDREQLVRNGRVIPVAIVLSHAEQRAYLAAGCPEAAPAAVVVGDPCYDQITSALAARDAHRRALGVGDGQRLVVVSSTWGRRSLLGRDPGVLARLLADLPAGDYRVAAVLHPNIEAHHGRFQLQHLLGACRRRGLVVVDPDAGWQAALAAADWVVGDHGSVTLYATATAAPILLAAFASGDVDPRSPVADLGRAAPRLRPGQPVEAQLCAAAEGCPRARYAAIARRITSEPGAFEGNMRALLYRLLHLDPPALDRPVHVRRANRPVSGRPVPPEARGGLSLR